MARFAAPGSRARCLPAALTVAVALASGTPAESLAGQRAPGPRFFPDDPIQVDHDDMDIGQVRPYNLSQTYDALTNSFGDRGRSRDRRAANVNTLDEVPDSSWFTNRIGGPGMTPAELAAGPDRGGPPVAGTWTVVGRPGSGATPKFTIEDPRGARYLLKLDPSDYPGMLSTAEHVSTRAFHAIGYHVPENTIAYLDPNDLVIRPGATFRGEGGYRRPITEKELAFWLEDPVRRADGTIQVIASRWLQGTPIGEFRYNGTRADDANDIVPHEDRRELRGLRVFAAWLNHIDSRAVNTFDALVESDGRRFIRHHLIDFGNTLGSNGRRPQDVWGGYEYPLQYGRVAKSLLSLGLWEREYAYVDYPRFRAIGRFEADYYEPWKWRPNYPNAAFDRLDDADAFWGARILARFTDAHIEALIASARMEVPEEAAYLVRILIRRRDKSVRHWISRTNPLDTFEVENASGQPVLRFDNAAEISGSRERSDRVSSPLVSPRQHGRPRDTRTVDRGFQRAPRPQRRHPRRCLGPRR